MTVTRFFAGWRSWRISSHCRIPIRHPYLILTIGKDYSLPSPSLRSVANLGLGQHLSLRCYGCMTLSKSVGRGSIPWGGAQVCKVRALQIAMFANMARVLYLWRWRESNPPPLGSDMPFCLTSNPYHPRPKYKLALWRCRRKSSSSCKHATVIVGIVGLRRIWFLITGRIVAWVGRNFWIRRII